MPLNYAVLSDGNCIIITDTTSATNIETIPKEKVVLQIVLAGEGQNKSGVDELWIQHDGQYSTEIPYTEADVASAGVAPVSVEAFRAAVLVLLNASSLFPIGGGKVITGYLTQIGTAAPTNVEIFNNSGITITPTYSSVGLYSLGNSVAFTEAKTYFNISHRLTASTGLSAVQMLNMYLDGSGTMTIETGDLSNGPYNDVLMKTPYIIIVFP